MKQKTFLRELTITAMCIALCTILPVAFHLIPNAGSIFSPMHIPVLLCGLTCGWKFGLLCGIVGPFFSSLLTQMPPMAYLPAMLFELAAYGIFTGIIMKYLHTKKLLLDLYISLILSMIIGRIIAGTVNAVLFQLGNYSFSIWVSSYFISAWPAIAIQLIFVPSIYITLEKAGLISKKY